MNLRVLDLLFRASSTSFAILAATQSSAKAVVLTPHYHQNQNAFKNNS